MTFRFSILKFFSNQLRLKSTNASLTKKNHYNSLGISPKSTQNEIKTAYYKLSMIYHPDKNKNDASSLLKFRSITEAYEVLGNVNTRKMYDKGLYFSRTITADETIDKFYKPREAKSKPPPPDGRTPIYDFDEWAKNHYGTTFQRQMENKRRSQEYINYRHQDLNDQKLEKMVFVTLALILLSMLLVNTKNYDRFSYNEHTIYTKKPTKED